MVNGFNGYGPEVKFNGKNGLRGGRQKAAESYINSPNYSFKLDFFGIKGLNIGLSGYFGRSQSVLYEGLGKSNMQGRAVADSSVIGVSMLGADMKFKSGGIHLKGQLIYNSMSNTDQYNAFTGSDLGASMLGYYVEAGYNILHSIEQQRRKLVPFLRYEKYNTHFSVPASMSVNEAYNRMDLTMGLGFWFTDQAVVKTDYQIMRNASGDRNSQINAGIGFMF